MVLENFNAKDVRILSKEKYKYILVDVFAYNQNAILFYEKQGYHSKMYTNIKKLYIKKRLTPLHKYSKIGHVTKKTRMIKEKLKGGKSWQMIKTTQKKSSKNSIP